MDPFIVCSFKIQQNTFYFIFFPFQDYKKMSFVNNISYNPISYYFKLHWAMFHIINNWFFSGDTQLYIHIPYKYLGIINSSDRSSIPPNWYKNHQNYITRSIIILCRLFLIQPFWGESEKWLIGTIIYKQEC